MACATAFIGLGANLGDARVAVLQALVDLDQVPGVHLVRASSLYRSAPVAAGGPDYVNAVAKIATDLAPLALLDQLQRLEQLAGRERPFVNAPRTLDLDLLLYENDTLDTPRLTIPHPRMWERAFVLVPLMEVAPDRVPAQALELVLNQAVTRCA